MLKKIIHKAFNGMSAAARSVFPKKNYRESINKDSGYSVGDYARFKKKKHSQE